MILSNEQKYSLEKFKKGENLFITGPGGTGKTKLIHSLVEHMEIHKIKYQVCAMTGCAALLIGCNARTLHSWSGIKLGKGPTEKIIKNIAGSKFMVKVWRKIKVLIVDEVSMMSKKIFELIEEIARCVRNNNRPFGGIQVIFSGDFYQLPPVGDYNEEDSSKFAFESEKWFQVFPLENNIQLAKIFRQTDNIYQKILLEIRQGEISEESKELLKTYVKRQYNKEEHNGILPSKIFPVKSKVEFVNKAMFSKIECDEYPFTLIEKTNVNVYLDNGKLIEPEVLEKCSQLNQQQKEFELEEMAKCIIVEKEFSLKVGALVMCTYNIDLENGICNGSQGIIVEFAKSLPVVLFSNKVKMVVNYQYIQNEEYPCLALGHMPLCLAWAMTIHKIQGATLDMAEMDLGKSVFEYGQTYVALSRIKSLDGLYLSDFYAHRIKANPLVKEFYSKLLTVPALTPFVIKDGQDNCSKENILDENLCKEELTEEVMEEEMKPIEENIFRKFAYQENPNPRTNNHEIIISKKLI